MGALAVPPRADAAFPGGNGLIAYQAASSSRGLFWAREPDGRGLRRFVAGGHVSDPAFSPAGRRLAFARNGAIWTMYLDGSVLRKLTLTPEPDGQPAWSPRGDQVVFTTGPKGKRRLWAVGADGAKRHQLSWRGPDDHAPAWSSRDQIAFVRPSKRGGQDIWVMAASALSATRLTRGRLDEESPAWSPDGTRIAFVRGRGGKGDVFVMDADGRHVRRLTRRLAASSPAWSPDGRRIAFSAGSRGRRQVFVIGSGGGRARQLTAGRSDAQAPDWQPSGGDPVIAAAGDIACDPNSANFQGGLGTPRWCHQMHTSDLLLKMDLAAVLMLGDAQYEDGRPDAFAASFEPSWGRLKGLIRPVVGNHEYRTPGAAGYFDYFDGPGRSDGAAGPRGAGSYSFDVGTWHLIALNSAICNLPGGAPQCAPGSPQEQWLRADLAAHPAQCTLAFWHHPLYSSSVEGDSPVMRPIWQALYDGGADVVLNGHAHIYERYAPQTPDAAPDPARGIRQFVVGTGGKSHQGFTALRANSELRDRRSYGVLALTLHPGAYDWSFLPAAGSHRFTDTGTSACH
jgi:dipeptidyl aminopeptidase/acylaminoacyl peptidase